MGLSTRLIVAGAVAGTAFAYYTRTRRARTGESYFDIVRALPATCCAGRTRPGRGRRWPSTRARARPATVTPSSLASSALRERHLAPEAAVSEKDLPRGAGDAERPFHRAHGARGLGARLDFSLEDLDDLFLATDRLLEAALDTERLESLRVEMAVDGSTLRVVAGCSIRRAALAGGCHSGGCIDLCTLLRRLVDDVVVQEGEAEALTASSSSSVAPVRAHERARRQEVNDPLDLEALPGQARIVPDEDDEGESPEQAHPGPSADPEGRGRADSEKLDQYLLRRYHLHGDRKAREQLITMYLPLVRSLARRYASRGEHFDDLVQVGAIGLIKGHRPLRSQPRRGAHHLRDAQTSSARSSATSATRAGRCACRAACRSSTSPEQSHR